MTKYGVIVGSIRENSYSKGVADALVAGLPADAEVTYLNIADLPLYNQDFDAASPEAYTRFRNDVLAQDAFIFVTPEHNRSIPAALKNALDVASRPWGQNVWAGKPALVASQSVSGIAGVLAHHVLRQTLVFLDMPTMQQPELYIGNVGTLADESGQITNADTKAFWLMQPNNLLHLLISLCHNFKLEKVATVRSRLFLLANKYCMNRNIKFVLSLSVSAIMRPKMLNIS